MTAVDRVKAGLRKGGRRKGSCFGIEPLIYVSIQMHILFILWVAVVVYLVMYLFATEGRPSITKLGILPAAEGVLYPLWNQRRIRCNHVSGELGLLSVDDPVLDDEQVRIIVDRLERIMYGESYTAAERFRYLSMLSQMISC